MYPKDFTTNCIINTVLEPAPLFIRIDGDLAGRQSLRNFEPTKWVKDKRPG